MIDTLMPTTAFLLLFYLLLDVVRLKKLLTFSAVVWYNIENVLGVEVMTFLEMYLNISKKFGQDSPQMNKFKEYFMQYKDKPHIVRKIYQSIMGEL